MTVRRSAAAKASLVIVALTLAVISPAQAASPVVGKARYEEQCLGCHSASPGPAESGSGPSLFGLVGRRAGTADTGYGYSPALRRSGVVWSAATLDRYITAPERMVTGTIMTIDTPSKADRDAIVAYLLTLKAAPGRTRSRR